MHDPQEFAPRPARVTEWLRENLLRRAGLVPLDVGGFWSSRFAELMRNRLEMGRFRYGPVNRGRFDSVSSARRRLAAYLDDGNLEHLVDAANLCMVEWCKSQIGLGEHPAPRWTPVDDGVHSAGLDR